MSEKGDGKEWREVLKDILEEHRYLNYFVVSSMGLWEKRVRYNQSNSQGYYWLIEWSIYYNLLKILIHFKSESLSSSFIQN